MMKKWIKSLIRRFGYDVTAIKGPESSDRADVDAAEKRIIERVRPYTATSVPRVLSVIDATRYLHRWGIEGDFAEAGVWRGGSMMAAALALKDLGAADRRIWLYDTFEGMTAPSEKDTRFDGAPATAMYQEKLARQERWTYASLEDVRANFAGVEYPEELLRFVPGKVEDTIPAQAPERIALLRLDTDWYESTLHELQHLFPRVVRHGIVIIDDYGHWQGARKAVDEYLATLATPVFLQRIDYTGRVFVKVD